MVFWDDEVVRLLSHSVSSFHFFVDFCEIEEAERTFEPGFAEVHYIIRPATMLFDFEKIAKKNYNIRTVPRSLIPSNDGTKQQILWVGCSDSIISETETLDVKPEEIFVHRNLGNILSNGDLSSASAVEWSLEKLKVGGSSALFRGV